MPPLFACAGCGVQIERSARSYVQQKGRLLCSTCRDKLDDAANAGHRDPEASGASEASEGG